MKVLPRPLPNYFVVVVVREATHFFGELCREKAIVAYTKPQQLIKCINSAGMHFVL